MRDEWYGDNRDLVKWGSLLTLAERYAVRHILQVLYYRPTRWNQLEIDGESFELPAAVIAHFRCATRISHIQCPTMIEVVPDVLGDRAEFQRILIDRVRTRTVFPSIVFLDPDTGLEPRSPGLEHVLDSEAADLWRYLRDGDLLALYQHQTNRAGRPWVEPKKVQFERALGIAQGAAKVAQSPIAKDVVLFYVQKSG